MKQLTIILVCLSLASCASTPREKRKEETLDCVKDLVDHDGSLRDAYGVCKDLYRSGNATTNKSTLRANRQ